MKKLCITFLILIIISVTAIYGDTTVVCGDYLRLHVRANSNQSCDQQVKYLVKDAVCEYLTPVVASCETKDEAIAALTLQLDCIEAVATRILAEHGFLYGATASIRRESFPTRVYEDITLSAGVYDALIINLGSGEGDNWWCVVYPPLCFTGGEIDVTYRSRIYAIISQFFGR